MRLSIQTGSNPSLVLIQDSMDDFYRQGCIRVGFDLNRDFQPSFGRINPGLWLKRYKTGNKLGGQPMVGNLGMPIQFLQGFQFI